MSDQPTSEAEPTPEAAPSAGATATAVEDRPATEPVAPAPVAVEPAAAPPDAAAPAAPATKRSVQVPVWLLAVLAVGVLTVGAFFLGRATAPDGDSGPTTLAEAVEQTASGEMEVGDFDVRSLIRALGENQSFDLGDLADRILGGGRR